MEETFTTTIHVPWQSLAIVNLKHALLNDVPGVVKVDVHGEGKRIAKHGETTPITVTFNNRDDALLFKLSWNG